MDSDGNRDARGTHADPVPRPAGPPEVPSVPPRPVRAPGTPGVPPLPDGSAFPVLAAHPASGGAARRVAVRAPAAPEEEPERVPGRQLLSGALIAFLVGWLIWSLLWNGYLGGWWLLPLYAMIPDSWAEPHSFGSVVVVYAYYVLIAGMIMVGVGRLGRWSEIWRRYGPPAWRRAVPGGGPRPPPRKTPPPGPRCAPPAPTTPPNGSPPRRARDSCGTSTTPASPVPGRASATAGTASPPSPARCSATAPAPRPHPSGARDLPARQARHDLVTGQVRIGTAADDARNPYAYRGTGLALGPDLLGTSPCSPSARRASARPAASYGRSPSRCACTRSPDGRGRRGRRRGRGPRPGRRLRRRRTDRKPGLRVRPRPVRRHDRPGRGAVVLAEALAGDLAEPHPGSDTRRSTTVLAQLLGPFRAVHGRFPGVPELQQHARRSARTAGRTARGAAGGRAGVAAARAGRARAADGPPRGRGRRAGRPGGTAGPAPPSPPSSTPRGSPGRSRSRPSTTRCGSASTCPSAATRTPRGCWPG